jgi:hypothetical protein
MIFCGKSRRFSILYLRPRLNYEGKSIICKYESTYDAQKAYEELQTSNIALFAANKIMEYLTTVRINDSSWHGSMENFITTWQEQFRRYERLVLTTSHY